MTAPRQRLERLERVARSEISQPLTVEEIADRTRVGVELVRAASDGALSVLLALADGTVPSHASCGDSDLCACTWCLYRRFALASIVGLPEGACGICIVVGHVPGSQPHVLDDGSCPTWPYKPENREAR